MEEPNSEQVDPLIKSCSRKRRFSVDSCLTKSISSSASPFSQMSQSLGSSNASLHSDFDAVDIKWTYSDSVLNGDAFKRDIYSIWRIAEAQLGLSPRFLEAQKMGVNESSRRDVLLNILRWRENIGITHETLHLAIYIFDKCLDSVQVSEETLKDIAAVSLVLASKCEEYKPLQFSNVKDIGLTSSDCVKTFGMWEKTILFEMGYRLSYPTSFMFMNYFHNCIESSLPVIQMTNYILELSLLSTKYRDFGGAFTAHAAICLSTAVLAGTSCSPVFVMKTTEDSLWECSGIEKGSTRTVMWHLLQDYIETAEDKNEIWMEYSSEQRCGSSNHQMPPTLIAALSDFSSQYW